jgi:hypothetical protein
MDERCEICDDTGCENAETCGEYLPLSSTTLRCYDFEKCDNAAPCVCTGLVVPCPACAGDGYTPEVERCAVCNGAGTVTKGASDEVL